MTLSKASSMDGKRFLAANHVFQIGRGKVDCTPEATGQVLMGWGDHSHRAHKISERLHIRCLWLKDPEGQSCLLFQYDLCMISELLVSRFIAALKQVPELHAENLKDSSFLFSATHTHAAP